jgi:hypothetical protein
MMNPVTSLVLVLVLVVCTGDVDAIADELGV